MYIHLLLFSFIKLTLFYKQTNKLLCHQVFFIHFPNRNPTMSSWSDNFRTIFQVFMLSIITALVIDFIYLTIRMCYEIFIKWWRSPSPATVAPETGNEVEMVPVWRHHPGRLFRMLFIPFYQYYELGTHRENHDWYISCNHLVAKKCWEYYA